MCWSRRFAVLILSGVFLATSAHAEKGDYILGAGLSADDADGLATTLIADLAVADTTWLSASVGRNRVELPRRQELNTWYADIAIDHYFSPAGIRFGLAYWGDSDIFDSVDVIGALYVRGENGSIAIDAERRDFELNLPPLDVLSRTEIPFHANGIGLSGRIDFSTRTDLHFSGMTYDYNVNLRRADAARVDNLLSISRLSLLSSLIDWRVSAGVGMDFGLKHWRLDVARWRGAIDGGDNHSVTLAFMTPMTDRTDIEFSLGYDDSDLYGQVTVFNVFLYFYGGH